MSNKFLILLLFLAIAMLGAIVTFRPKLADIWQLIKKVLKTLILVFGVISESFNYGAAIIGSILGVILFVYVFIDSIITKSFTLDNIIFLGIMFLFWGLVFFFWSEVLKAICQA